MNGPAWRLFGLHLVALSAFGAAVPSATTHHLGVPKAVPFVRVLPPVAAASPAPAPHPVKIVLPPPPPPAPPAPVARPRALVLLGDSVPAAADCGCAGFGGNLASANAPAALTNEAQDGMTTAGVLDQLSQPSVVNALRAATVVTVTVGANDFDEGQASRSSCLQVNCFTSQLQSTTATLSQVTHRIAALVHPGTVVALTGYWNVFLDGAVGAQQGSTYVATSDALTRQLNADIAMVAQASHDQYVDLYSPFKGTGSTDDTALLAPDGDHPSSAGHRVIAAAIARVSHLSS